MGKEQISCQRRALLVGVKGSVHHILLSFQLLLYKVLQIKVDPDSRVTPLGSFYNRTVSTAIITTYCDLHDLVGRRQRRMKLDERLAPFQLIGNECIAVGWPEKEVAIAFATFVQVDAIAMPPRAFQQKQDIKLVMHED